MTNQKILAILYLHRTQGDGVERVHILGMAKAFEEAGAIVDIFSPHGIHRPFGESRPALQRHAKKSKSGMSLVSKYAPEILFEIIEIAYNAVAAFRLSRMNTRCYDFVFERYSIFSIVGAFLAKRGKIPLIIEVNYTSRSKLVRERSRMLKPLAHMIDRWVFNTATLLTPVSTALKEELIHEFGIPQEKILVLPNAADPACFVPRTARCFTEKKKTIGFVGGFYPWHGLDLLIKAFSSIADSYPESQVMLIGDGPELGRIQRLVSQSGLDSRIIFSGRKRHEELPEVMHSFYLGVMPDSNDYGSPMKIFEYMALGIPVVAPDYRPLQDVIHSGEQGLLFQKQNISGLASALARLLEDPPLAARLGAAGRKAIENDRNWNMNAAKIFSHLITSEA